MANSHERFLLKESQQKRAATFDCEGSSTKTIPRSCGRISMYENLDWNKNKEWQRDQIVKSAKRLFGYTEGLSVLSMPGESWRFEAAILSTFPRSSFVCIEADRYSFEAGLRNMPFDIGINRYRDTFNVSGREVEALSFKGRAHYINAHLDQFFFGIPKGKNKGIWHASTSRGFNLIWLDLNSPLCNERSLSYLDESVSRLKRNSNSLLAVSFVIGRDDPNIARVAKTFPGDSGLEKRASFLRFLVNKNAKARVLSETSFAYSSTGHGTLKIGTCCLFITKKSRFVVGNNDQEKVPA